MKLTAKTFELMVSILAVMMVFWVMEPACGQMPPPGYERELQMRKARENIPVLDRDSITVVDTAVIFDPSTYESETKIITTRYSLRDYCKQFLGINDPDMLLDHQNHTIIDPKTYNDLTIRMNASGKIDTIPK
jgi:hypothetical protein